MLDRRRVDAELTYYLNPRKRGRERGQEAGPEEQDKEESLKTLRSLSSQKIVTSTGIAIIRTCKKIKYDDFFHVKMHSELFTSVLSLEFSRCRRNGSTYMFSNF